MPNLVSLTHPSFLYWAKFRQEYFRTIAFSKGTIFAKNADFFAKKKNMLTSVKSKWLWY